VPPVLPPTTEGVAMLNIIHIIKQYENQFDENVLCLFFHIIIIISRIPELLLL
jgi:hypothetical protein